MEATKVGIREFRDKLATYLLEAETPIAITRHGDTVGFYIPARRKRTENDREALKEAAASMQAMLGGKGISEDEVLADFKRWRGARRK
jgi:PHD/YefM family antitoxin component YafN of YafNO toxin-antitoxin module